ncbi:MAG: undecaprenyldiphospho-muramoylpentapeptide beta-N-acetylglucosaminyltransferase [Chitinivibrionales bacterium]|nr:undecaprenyldiphospho-muramoylpentapeptide beta-N-acetylglucosaminyltransferase [Chitinivibrionales bacterium]
MKVAIAAGGTGGHVFPALSVARALRKKEPSMSLLWFGTRRNREKELCQKDGIPIEFLAVSSSHNRFSIRIVGAIMQFARETCKAVHVLKRERPDTVIAFGGYVSAPVLAAALYARIPFFLHEQNTVPGFVNRLFSRFAKTTFLGFPLVGNWKLGGELRVVGTPVREIEGDYKDFRYPETIDRAKKTVLICGGSQGALSMNRLLVKPVLRWAENNIQVIWQTGAASAGEIRNAIGNTGSVVLYESIEDLYPFYAIAKVVVGRSGASTLAEVAYFGLPCITIPLPWSAENHQWMNAGLIEAQGWGIRIAQDENGGKAVEEAVIRILSDQSEFESMSMKALDNGLTNAASVIADGLLAQGENDYAPV